jgi:hypothetical protein
MRKRIVGSARRPYDSLSRDESDSRLWKGISRVSFDEVSITDVDPSIQVDVGFVVGAVG